MFSTALAVLGALSLYVLPGSWVSFAARDPTLGLRARLALAVVLSPIVVVAEYLLLHLAGASFRTAAVVLPLVNLPVALIVVPHVRRSSRPGAASVAQWTVVLIFLSAYLVAFMGNSHVRANHGHAWLHTDIVYMLADRNLPPEEPHLAGFRLAYPWTGHLYQGLISFLLGAAPNSSYLLTNIIWLMAVIATMAEIVARLGGDRLSQQLAAVWLAFGVNFLGSLGRLVAPASVVDRYPIWGDPRYTPWLRKFGIFESTVFGIGLFAAVALMLIHRGGRAGNRLLLGTAVVSAAVLYPVLFPAVAALITIRVALTLVEWRRSQDHHIWSELSRLLAVMTIGAIAVIAHLALLTRDATEGSTFALATLSAVQLKLATSVVVLAPLTVGVMLTPHHVWREHRTSAALLFVGSIAMVSAYVLLNLAFWSEYKYVFAAAICLTPFASLAVRHLLNRAGRAAFPLAVAAGIVLFAPASHRLWIEFSEPPAAPRLDTSSFDLRLAPAEPLAAVADAVRELSPKTAVLITRATPFDWVALTQRPLYVAFGDDTVHGLGQSGDDLLKLIRGYPEATIDRRRETVLRLFDGGDSAQRAQAARIIIQDVKRPLVVIAMLDDLQLVAWLNEQPRARAIYSGSTASAWLLTSADLNAR